MKKLILILFMLPLLAISQRWVEGDTLNIRGGGSFGDAVSLDTAKFTAGGELYYYIMRNDTVFINSDTVVSGGGTGYWTRTGDYVYPATITDSVGVGTYLSFDKQFNVKGGAYIDALVLATGSEVNEIETILTDDDTNLPTSGAVYDAVGAKSDVSVANQSDNRIITATGTTDALNAEIGFTFDGDVAKITTTDAQGLHIYRNSANSGLKIENDNDTIYMGINDDDNISLGSFPNLSNASLQITQGGDAIFSGDMKATTQTNTVQNGSKTASFTHDAESGDIGAYALSTANAVVISIHNLSDGMQGTIFLNIGTLPSSVTLNTYSDAGTTGLTEVILGTEPTKTASKAASITYTCASDGTNTYVYLVIGQQY